MTAIFTFKLAIGKGISRYLRPFCGRSVVKVTILEEFKATIKCSLLLGLEGERLTNGELGRGKGNEDYWRDVRMLSEKLLWAVEGYRG